MTLSTLNLQKPVILIVSILALLAANAAIQKAFNASSATEVTSVSDLFRKYPERVRSLMHAIDLVSEPLSRVANHLHGGDTVAACESLINHFQEVQRGWVITTLEQVPQHLVSEQSGMLNRGIVSINEVEAQVPLLENRGWKWDFTGPNEDDEFGYSLNSHRYLNVLYFQYLADSETSHVKTFDKIIKDWIIQHPLPEKGDSVYLVLDPALYLDYRDIGEVEWRTLEAGRRLGAVWPQLFYGFQDSEEFSAAARLLMLSSIHDQAEFLMKYHKRGHNWTTMEMNGLALAGLAFPEFRESERWANYALDVMAEEINRQVYPDGVQTEISTKTQWVALRRFESIADNFQKVGRDIADAYLERVEEMYNYLAYCMRPDGHQPLNNDSDREDLRERIQIAADNYGRSDWKYIATNGVQGEKPDGLASVTFPWSGIQIMRSGWQKESHWAFFDFGPYGTGHQHRDMLHLSVTAYGHDLLVDGGRFTHQDYFSFDPAIWRGYFRSTQSHNTILIDRNGQQAGRLRAMEPTKEGIDYIHRPAFDYATGSFRSGYKNTSGEVVHHRAVLYIRNQYWLVLDQIETDRPRELNVLWHYAPEHDVKLEGTSAKTINEGIPNLTIQPIGRVHWETEIIEGQENPIKQGWYSETYGQKEPNPTLIYKTGIVKSEYFAWLLIPSDGVAITADVQFSRQNEDLVFEVKVTQNSVNRILIPVDRNAGDVVVQAVD
jgi:hypothetical protein